MSSQEKEEIKKERWGDKVRLENKMSECEDKDWGNKTRQSRRLRKQREEKERKEYKKTG